MSGWPVALILYLIPLLVGMIPAGDPTKREPQIWEVLLWPAFMLIGTVILYLRWKQKP